MAVRTKTFLIFQVSFKLSCANSHPAFRRMDIISPMVLIDLSIWSGKEVSRARLSKARETVS